MLASPSGLVLLGDDGRFRLVGDLQGIAGGAALGVAVGWRTRDPRRGVAFGAVLGVVGGFAINAASVASTATVSSAVLGVGVGVLLSAFSVLPHAVAERIAGPWAGALTGALGGAVNFALDDPLSPLPTVILLGLTLAWWRPVLLYPFLTAWNLLLLHADERRTGSRPSLLRWHSAFWDESQRLPLLGLDQHLILVAARNPVEGQAAIEYLATSHQRWAAQKVQSELDARQVGKEMPR